MENIKNEINDNINSIEDFSIILNNQEIEKENYNLINFKMTFKENTHTNIELELKIKNTSLKEWITYNIENKLDSSSENIQITLLLKERKFFMGIVQKLILEEYYSNEFKIKLSLKSYSEILDRNKVFRVFQNPDLTYYDLVRRVTDSYMNYTSLNLIGITNDEKRDRERRIIDRYLSKKIFNGLIVQYDETDWEFLTRIVSHLGLALFNTENGGITIGLSKDTSIEKIWNEKRGHISKVQERKRIYYKGNNLAFYICGERIIQENKVFLGYVTEGNIILEDNKLKGEYIIKKEEYIFPLISNEKIKGCAIEGKIKRIPLNFIEKNRIAYLTVDFSQGLEKIVKLRNKKIKDDFYEFILGKDEIVKNSTIKRFFFPYATPYSKTKTGLFCSPEIGDTIIVFFPSSDESEAYVLTAINNENSIRFSNPFYRDYKLTKLEEEIVGELSVDFEEKNNKNSTMELAVSSEKDILCNIKLDRESLEMFLNALIQEKTNVKSTEAMNHIGVESKNTLNITSKVYSVNITEEAIEKSPLKTFRNNKEYVYGEEREETVNNVRISANSHNVTIK